jgi:hypothetical protein
VPSAAAEKGRQCPDADIAGVLLKHMYMKIVFGAFARETVKATP